jgi:hypothetical protein
VKFGTVVVCSKCKQPIASGQGFGYVCFKIPGKEGWLRANYTKPLRVEELAEVARMEYRPFITTSAR